MVETTLYLSHGERLLEIVEVLNSASYIRIVLGACTLTAVVHLAQGQSMPRNIN